MTERIWLDVPFPEKDEAKQHGARWDPAEKRWYAPRPGMTALQRWAALPDVGDLLPGEDRSFGSGLFVDPVPSSCWFTNVRSCVAVKDWERLRRMVTRRAKQRCEACDRGENRPSKRWMEVHERWSYDERSRVQALRRLVCLCTDCHRATHFGLAQVRGHADQAFAHLRSVTGMSEAAASEHVRAAFAVWEQRSGHQWSLNLRVLTDAGVTVTPPPDKTSRVTVAARELRKDVEH